MSLLVHLSLWPWKRTTANSGEVAATTGGIDDLWPCGMSTQTKGSLCARIQSSVSFWLAPSNQEALRNSKTGRSGLHRATTSSTYSLLDLRMPNQGGNWNRIAPSFLASTSGSRALRNRVHTSSYACGG